MAWDVICLGELFIDLVPFGKAEERWLYAPSPGGAPGNVAVGLARLGLKPLMISRVGDEAFGRLLVSALQSYGVDTSGVVLSPTEKTGVSVVTLDEKGERSFMFYHDAPADLHIDPAAIDPAVIASARLLHVGVLPLSGATSAAAQRRAIDVAAQAGVILSCDLNFRPNLWADPRDMLAAGRELVARSAIVKMSAEELRALQGGQPEDEAVAALWHDGLCLLSVTKGADGASLHTPHGRYDCSAFAVDAVDTTGAGDAYTAALLAGVLLTGAAEETTQELLLRACAAGGLATMRKGAMEAQPSRHMIDDLIAAQKTRVSFTPRKRD